jgi:antitoxin component YwqK of YwqJK toxin-antitoxin module
MEQAQYSKGRRHGPTTWFFSSGQKERMATFWYDQLHGLYEEYWPNGRLAVRANYVYGLLTDRIEYDEYGKVVDVY